MKVVKEPTDIETEVMKEVSFNSCGCDCDCDKAKVKILGH